jgi:hypothetical protein
LRNYVLAGVLTCDERGMFPLRSSMLAILDFWEWKGASERSRGTPRHFAGRAR